MSSSEKYGYLNISELSSPGTTFTGTFDLRIQYFTMACNIGKNLEKEERDWSLRFSQSKSLLKFTFVDVKCHTFLVTNDCVTIYFSRTRPKFNNSEHEVVKR